MTTHSGTCLCGASGYEFDGTPKFAIRCFCTECQKATGSGSAPQIGVAATSVRLRGALAQYRKTAESGSDLVFGFCGSCGSPIYKTTSKAPELIFLCAGSVEQPEIVPALNPVYEDSRMPWDE